MTPRPATLAILLATSIAQGCGSSGGGAGEVLDEGLLDKPVPEAAEPAREDQGPDGVEYPVSDEAAREGATDAAHPDGAPDARGDPPPLPPPVVDLDGDGLDDPFEDLVARRYRPHLAIHPDEGCPRMVIVYRVRPHPSSPGRLHVIWDVLYERDCGAGGHPGDDEVHAATVDPTVPPPAGILAVRAVAHQGTACDRASTCGQCGLDPCETVPRDGVAWPVVYSSLGKHATYTSDSDCDYACFFADRCAVGPDPDPPMVNAGEPGSPLVTDLTAAGLITAGAGWTEQALMHYDPWGDARFGEAGIVSQDLVDPAFDTPDPGCCDAGCSGLSGS